MKIPSLTLLPFLCWSWWSSSLLWILPYVSTLGALEVDLTPIDSVGEVAVVSQDGGSNDDNYAFQQKVPQPRDRQAQEGLHQPLSDEEIVDRRQEQSQQRFNTISSLVQTSRHRHEQDQTAQHASYVSSATGKINPKFGHEMLNAEFLLNYTNLNHGSYGSCPKYVLEYQSMLRQQQEQQPDIFMREHYKVLLNQTSYEIAIQVLNVEHPNETLVLVESASTAMNSIVRSMEWNRGDIIICFSIEYAMFNNVVRWLQEMYGVELLQIPISFPIIEEGDKNNDEEDISITAFTIPLQNMLEKLKEESKIDKLKLAVFDHISSAPAVKEPIKELALLVKQYNQDCFVIVDGAHAMGQLIQPPLRIHPTTVGPIDAYFSNGHKWFYSPKGSAVLWINQSITTNIFPEPTVISSANSIAQGTSLIHRYEYVSTRDYTNILSLSKALQFRREVCGGELAIYNYTRTLALEAKHHLIKRWNISSKQILVPDSMEEFMINVPLPENTITTTSMANQLMTYLLEEHNIYARIMPWVLEPDGVTGHFYTRLSSQIYLELSDFIRFGDAVLEFLRQRKLL